MKKYMINKIDHDHMVEIEPIGIIMLHAAPSKGISHRHGHTHQQQSGDYVILDSLKQSADLLRYQKAPNNV